MVTRGQTRLKACVNMRSERDRVTALGTDVHGERRRNSCESRRIGSTAHETRAQRLSPFTTEEAVNTWDGPHLHLQSGKCKLNRELRPTRMPKSKETDELPCRQVRANPEPSPGADGPVDSGKRWSLLAQVQAFHTV